MINRRSRRKLKDPEIDYDIDWGKLDQVIKFADELHTKRNDNFAVYKIPYQRRYNIFRTRDLSRFNIYPEWVEYYAGPKTEPQALRKAKRSKRYSAK